MNRRFFQYKTVLKKELIDAFRDRKSIFATFIMPLILFPLMFLFMGSGVNDIESKSLSPTVAIFTQDINYEPVDMDTTTEFTTFIKTQLFSFAQAVDATITYKTSQDLLNDILDANISVAVVVPENIKYLIENNQTADIKIIYDERSNVSFTSASVIQTIINAFGDAVNNDRASSHSINIHSTQTMQSGISSEFPDFVRSGTDNSFLMMVLPLLITIIISIGGLNIAIDLVAGEKERNTFESLLSTSASRFSILSAKFSVIIIFSLITAISEILAIIMSILIGNNTSLFGKMAGITLPIDSTILVVLNIFAMCALFSSLLLILTSTANTTKEANAKTLLILIVPTMIAYSTIYMEPTNLSLFSAFIPIYNVNICIKLLLSGILNFAYLWISLGANILYGILAILITLKSFDKESLISK